MENKSPINDIMETSLNNLKKIIDVNTVIGEPIVIAGGPTIIPVSKVSFGIGTGGSDIPTKDQSTKFGGGSGAGATITPLAFLVINGTDVKILHLSPSENTAERLVGMVPEVVDKVSDIFSKKGKKEVVVAEEDSI